MKIIMKRIKILVCGIVFGRYYIEGIMQLPELFELVGIVSRGSKQSAEIASKYKVPLYTDIETISKKQVDIVCVVVKSSIMGGEGTEIAFKFLEKGIHVIQEQPIHFDDYKRCLLMAKKACCKYQLNTFYPYLYAVEKFIRTSHMLSKNMPITYIRAESSVQVLFPLLDILNRILNGLNPYRLECLKGTLKQRFVILNGDIKNIPLTLTIDNQMDVMEPESDLTMFHRITVGTPKGTLMLTDTHGTVLWTPVFHKDLKEAVLENRDVLSAVPAQVNLITKGVGKLGDIVLNKWPKCIAIALTELYKDIENKKYITVENQQTLTLCQMWNEIGGLLGTYENIEIPLEKPIGLTSIFSEVGDK